MSSVHALHVTPRAIPYCPLPIAAAFKDLTKQQKLYAHHMMAASWCGVPIVAEQLSRVARPLLRVFYQVFSAQPLAELRTKAAAAGVAEDDVLQFLEYFALFYTNMGNYLSFGDSKFVPACSREVFATIVRAAAPNAGLDEAMLQSIYDLSPAELALDYPPTGCTAYYSSNISAEDAVLANEFLTSKQMNGINTRVWKEADGSLTIRVASIEERKTADETFKGRHIRLAYGEYKEDLARVVEHLRLARPHVENPTQERMVDHYIRHFQCGDVNAHKDSQKEWVKDVGPVVETNLGFIESYRDPSGVRAEWEGFVAVVNKDQSRKYADLVAGAEAFITRLPWGRNFEKDVFSSPDFTSLEVLGFASSGIPSGICIPNYDDIRQDHGFKNVYLANVVSAINFNDKLSHLTEKDWALYKSSFINAMSVNVGVHELLGHGTGKLLAEKEDGSFNFDRSIIDPLSGKAVATWYKPGETYGSVFGGLGSSYEECRAEATALYLCVHADLLQVFKITGEEEQKNTIFVCWLNMVRAGLLGLEFYTPETQQWRQAHMRARFCILQALLTAPNPVVHITEDKTEGLLITIDGDRIATDGVAAIGDLLLNLSVNKSVADVKRGAAYYERLTSVDAQFAKYREVIMEKRKPRKQFVQAHTTLTSSNDVEVEEFPGSVDGVVASFLARHKDFPL